MLCCILIHGNPITIVILKKDTIKIIWKYDFYKYKDNCKNM